MDSKMSHVVRLVGCLVGCLVGKKKRWRVHVSLWTTLQNRGGQAFSSTAEQFKMEEERKRGRNCTYRIFLLRSYGYGVLQRGIFPWTLLCTKFGTPYPLYCLFPKSFYRYTRRGPRNTDSRIPFYCPFYCHFYHRCLRYITIIRGLIKRKINRSYSVFMAWVAKESVRDV